MQKLIQGLLSLFLKERVFLRNGNLRSIARIKEIDLSDANNYAAKCNLGSPVSKELEYLNG